MDTSDMENGEEVSELPAETEVDSSEECSSDTEINEIMALAGNNTELENKTDIGSSSQPQFALCKYRWSKTLPTDSSEVLFYSSVNQNEPVPLVWIEDQSAYYSDERRVQCGDFTGNVSVDGRLIPVEEFRIRSYTFEVDLFTRDDIIEDIVGVDEIQEAEKNLQQQSNTAKNIDTYNDINSSLSSLNKSDNVETNARISNKYEDLMHPQTDSDSQDKFQTMSNHNSERGTPTINGQIIDGDRVVSTSPHTDVIDDVLTVQDLKQSKSFASDHSAHSSARQSPYKSQDGSHQNSARATPEHDQNVISQHGSQSSLGQITTDRAVDEMFGIQAVPLSEASSRSGPARQAPQKQVDSNVSSPARSNQGSARQTPVSGQVTPVLTPARSGQGSSRQSPQVGQTEVIEDVLGAVTPDSVHSDRVLSADKPSREKISDHFVPSDEKLYGGPEIRYGGSQQNSKQSSRSTSITSDSEINFSGKPGSLKDISRTPLFGSADSSLASSPARSNSAASLPNVHDARAEDADIRTRTPDNYIRLPNRSPEPRGSVGSHTSTPNSSSRASSRTITPIVTSGGRIDNGYREGDHRLEDLEASIANLRKLLCSRENEVHELQAALRDSKDVIGTLQDEIERSNKRAHPSSDQSPKWESKYYEIQGEKEVLSAEVVKLRDELEDVYRMQEEGSGSSGIRRYSPNNPYALQRKVAELESHIQDLHEANESSTNALAKAESKIRHLQEDNERLSSGVDMDRSELLKKCTRLQDRIDKLYKYENSGDASFHRRAELEQLRDDYQTMRDKNVHLHEENIRLRDEVTNLRHSPGKPIHLSRGYGEEDHRTEPMTTEESSTDREMNHDSTQSYSDISATRTYLSKYEALKDKSSSLTNPRLDYSSLDRHRSLPRDRHYDKSDYNYSDSILKDSRSLPKTRDYSSLDKLNQERSKPDGAPVTDKSTTELSYDKYSSLSRTEPLSSGLRRSKSEKDMIEREYLEALKYDKLRTEGDLKTLTSLHYPEPPRLSQRNVDSYQGEDKYTSSGKDPDRYLKSYTGDTTRKSHIMNRSFEEKYSNFDRRDPGLNTISSRYGEDSRKKSYMEDSGDFSDTATDILVSTEAYNKVLGKKSHSRKSHKRQNSVDSASSLSDAEDDFHYNPSILRQRSKSADGRVRSSIGLNQTKSEKSSKLSLTSGFRSIAPRPIPTQHNKNTLEQSSIMSRSLTQGLRPFAPRNPADVKVGDVVKFSRQGGKLSQGYIKYIGHLPGRSDIYLGVELDKEEGKHDGSFEGRRYFTCKSSKGVFVAFNKVVMAWTPYSG